MELFALFPPPLVIEGITFLSLASGQCARYNSKVAGSGAFFSRHRRRLPLSIFASSIDSLIPSTFHSRARSREPASGHGNAAISAYIRASPEIAERKRHLPSLAILANAELCTASKYFPCLNRILGIRVRRSERKRKREREREEGRERESASAAVKISARSENVTRARNNRISASARAYIFRLLGLQKSTGCAFHELLECFECLGARTSAVSPCRLHSCRRLSEASFREASLSLVILFPLRAPSPVPLLNILASSRPLPSGTGFSG